MPHRFVIQSPVPKPKAPLFSKRLSWFPCSMYPACMFAHCLPSWPDKLPAEISNMAANAVIRMNSSCKMGCDLSKLFPPRDSVNG